MLESDTRHVALDLDDVILNFTGGIWDAVEVQYGITLPPHTGRDINIILDPILGQSWWSWLKRGDLWVNFEPIAGALSSIKHLRKQGHYLEIVTAKPRWAERTTWQWLGIHQPAVQRVTIVDMDTRKVDVTDADIIIDDRPSIVTEFADDGRVGILFDQPSNSGAGSLGPGTYRAVGWNEAVRLVEMEAGGKL